MSDDGPDSDRVLEMLSRALTEDGELLPTNVEEVAAAEAEKEVPLPASLRHLLNDEGAVKVTSLDDRRAQPTERSVKGSGWSHVGALFVGAVAAAAAMLLFQRPTPVGPPLGGDTAVTPSSTSSAPTPPIEIAVKCEGCCAGKQCASARDGLESCPSGRTCVACDAALYDSRYRVRLSAVTPTALGESVMRSYPKGDPEICVRAGVSQEVCVDTRIDDRDGGPWVVVPAVFYGSELAAKVAVRLRWKGVPRESLATAGRWTQPVALTAKALCNGYRVELVNDAKEEVFGTMSLFLDDAHYVEIARAEKTATLRELVERLTVRGAPLQLFETAAPGDRRFVLSSGPLHRGVAEDIRWRLLEAGLTPKMSVGSDFVGEPLPLP